MKIFQYQMAQSGKTGIIIANDAGHAPAKGWRISALRISPP